MSAGNTEASRAAFEAWADDYGLRAEPNYSKDTEADCLAAWQASRKAALEEAANVAKTTCHRESTPFADGFNQAALSIEHVIKELLK